jgi:hypothetical protein
MDAPTRKPRIKKPIPPPTISIIKATPENPIVVKFV